MRRGGGQVLRQTGLCFHTPHSLCSVTVSLVRIKGTDCKALELGQVADKTGGEVCVCGCVCVCVCMCVCVCVCV